MYIPEHLFSLGRLFSYYSVRKDKISLQLKRVHHTPLLRQNENFEYCQQDLKKYVYPLMTPLENLLRNNTVLYSLSLPFPFTSPCARSSPCLAWAQWLALEIILSLQMTKQVPTGGPWGKITQLRTSWSSRGPWCLLESHWWHWRCEGNSVKRSSSPPAGKSWGTETQHYPSVMPLMTFLNDIYHPMVTVPLNDGVLRELGFGGLQRDCVSSTSKWLFWDQDYKEKVKHNSFCFLYRSVNGAF